MLYINNKSKKYIMYRIKLYLLKGESDYNGQIQTEDRFIIVDNYNEDCCGTHMTYDEAIKFLNCED